MKVAMLLPLNAYKFTLKDCLLWFARHMAIFLSDMFLEISIDYQ